MLKKWMLFVTSIGEKPGEDRYNQHMWKGLSAKDIVNPASDFRKISKRELSRIHLNTRGSIRLYEELLKDGLVTLDKPANYDLGMNGYIVNGKKMTGEQIEKYKTLLKEEFGYENKGSSSFRMQAGPLPDHTLAMELEKLYAKIENN